MAGFGTRLALLKGVPVTMTVHGSPFTVHLFTFP
jgi:hypothetical protein